MKHRKHLKLWLRRLTASGCAALLALGPPAAALAAPDGGPHTTTPIKHVIVIVGENHTFDNVFGVYQPRSGQTVWNLLSKEIVTLNGDPDTDFGKAAQNQANDSPPSKYSIAPTITGPYSTLPQPFTTYAYGQPLNVPDKRFPSNLPNGPFQITKYDSYQVGFTGDPIHRFFQMWQQFDEGKSDLFAWVALQAGIGPDNTPPAPTPGKTLQGGDAMGFYNMSQGDAPVFKFIADNYAMSDNYHQPIMGGTGANFIALGTGDVGFFSDGFGKALAPPPEQVENPDPQPGTNDFFTQDGYGDHSVPKGKGGSYVKCADKTQPGVDAILDYLESLPYHPAANCAADHYYLVNNYGPGFNPDGTTKPIGSGNFTLPPQTLPTIADSLSANGISWKYYIGGWNGGKPNDTWCSICNPFEFVRSIMTTSLRSNIQDIPQFYSDLAAGTLPAVSFIRPYEGYAGHPANSTLSLYEDFIENVANAVINRPELFDSTAILVTTDEGGGYYDSGYIQPLDFFGDGTRIPLLVISPFVKPGFIDHTYYDHVSILKFIEANWGLPQLSTRSRDNLANPNVSASDPYRPLNSPAIGDLMGLFDFTHKRNKNETPLIIPGGI